MDTERLELAEDIAQTGHEINWKATGRKAPYGDNTKKRKIMKAIDILREKNLMHRRLEKGRVSDNFAYCLSKHWENKKRARSAKRDAWIKDIPPTGGKRIAMKKVGGKGFR
ncbi:unnamed protein product [Protopolystoma xenopodis]|uniref:Uncharacterized protein n=1 Tax=Protopolystoma xenopodis TaxID=117903 RepID=A0A448WGD6_9PLAT|nr:unnamed protein product [Protopolystoma xenopodis]